MVRFVGDLSVCVVHKEGAAVTHFVYNLIFPYNMGQLKDVVT